MPNPARRLAALGLAVFFSLAAVASTPGAAAAALSVDQAEAEVVRLINEQRSSAGIAPVRVDARLTALARQRSTNMTTYNYFSHTQPDGRGVFDLIAESGITWYGGGEILAWNNYPTLEMSAVAARDGWLGSPSHREVMMSGGYNYVGVGLSIDADDGHKVWTGVFIKGPATAAPAPVATAPAPVRTGAFVTFRPMASVRLAGTASSRAVRVYWSGGRRYQVQLRADLHGWRWLSTSTTTANRAVRVWRGHRYDLRVRVCATSGCGGWRIKTLRG